MKDDLLEQVFRALDVCGLERQDAGQFRVLGAPPDWLQELAGGDAAEGASISLSGRFEFLDHFLTEAEEFWAGEGEGSHCSGPWTETSPSGDSHLLEAMALRSAEGQKVLLIRHQDPGLRQQRNVLQKARERALEHSNYRRAVEKKDVLLHCIVHDLKTPLTSLVQGAALLEEMGDLSSEQAKVLQHCSRSAKKQQALIENVLESFAADLDSMDKFEFDASKAPSLPEVAREAVQESTPSFDAKKVGLRYDSQLSSRRKWKVVADRSGLLRVFGNLLENALRYSLAESEVVVRLLEAGKRIRVEVLDSGPGVEEGLRATVFDKFSKARKNPGSTGLGLFICRGAVERWGGQIGYEPRPEGGACFWFELSPA